MNITKKVVHILKIYHKTLAIASILCLWSVLAFAQADYTPEIEVKQNGSSQGYAQIANCTTGMTCTASSGTWTLSASGGGGSGNSMTYDITQTTHGFSVGDVVYYTGTVYAKAKADVTSTSDVVGIVTTVTSANAFTITLGGYISTLSGLTAGTIYFLSDGTAGLLTSTEPTTANHISKPLLVAISTTAGYMFNWRGMTVGTSGISGSGTSGQVAYFNGSSSVTSSSALTFNGSVLNIVNGGNTLIGDIGFGTYGGISFSGTLDGASGALSSCPGCGTELNAQAGTVLQFSVNNNVMAAFDPSSYNLNVVGGYSSNSQAGVDCSGDAAYSTGGIVTGCLSSDITTKTNVIPAVSLLDKITQLTPIYFDYNIDFYKRFPKIPKNSRLGLSAQELQTLIPSAVVTNNFPATKVQDVVDGKPVTKTQDATVTLGIDYTQVSAALVLAIKELKKENDLIKTELCNHDNVYSWCN